MPKEGKQSDNIKALYGGTFDPPHFGHLYPLLETADALNLPRIELLPSHVPVFKTHASSIEHRLNMTRLLAKLDPRLSVNTIELAREKASYTVDTLAELKQQNPEQTLVFIIGSDSLANIHKWHKWRQLFDYCHIVVMIRPSEDMEVSSKNTDAIQHSIVEKHSKNNMLASKLYDFHTARLLFDDLVNSKMDRSSYSYLLSKLAPADVAMHDSINQGCMNIAFTDIIAASATGKLWLVNNQQIAVSSTLVREHLKQGENVDKWLPKSVIDYINQHQLYH